jgi:transcriptional regulator with XRE-family HTH domain
MAAGSDEDSMRHLGGSMTFAEQLRAARKRLRLTQDGLATLLGVSFEAISKWERGLFEPSKITQEGALTRLKRKQSKTL